MPFTDMLKRSSRASGTRLVPKIFFALAMFATLTGCNSPEVSNDPDSSPAATTPTPDSDPANNPATMPARFFSSDTRSENVDGIVGLNPILSPAPPDCDSGQPTATAAANVPPCAGMTSLSYNSSGPDTMIRATVFVPEHSPGETFPVVLHSHGWGDSRASTPRDGSESLYVYFGQVEALLTEFWQNGYVVVSFDERGWGESEGDIMVMSPFHETRDARAVLDWVVDLALNGDIPVAIDAANGNDLDIGLIGSSYGGGFQFPLAATDPRVDTIIANGTWYSLLQSIIPNDALKGTFGNLLCVASAQRQNRHDHLLNACVNMLLPTARTAADLDGGMGVLDFMRFNGTDYQQRLLDDGSGFHDEDPAYTQRPLDVLLIQGMIDVLFNHSEALDNYRYYRAAGGDVRVLSNQAGHMNIIRAQVEGSEFCGAVDPLRASRNWFDVKLKGQPDSLLDAIPEICISLDDDNALILDGIPGRDTSLDTTLGIDTTATALSFNISPITTTDMQPVFTVPVGETDWVLAGVPRLSNFEVLGGVAYLGVVIERGGEEFLVDEQPLGFDSANYGNQELISIAEQLQPGDTVGIRAWNTHNEFVFVGGPNAASALANIPGVPQAVIDQVGGLAAIADTNTYTVSGEAVLPLFRVPEQSPMRSVRSTQQ